MSVINLHNLKASKLPSFLGDTQCTLEKSVLASGFVDATFGSVECCKMYNLPVVGKSLIKVYIIHIVNMYYLS